MVMIYYQLLDVVPVKYTNAHVRAYIYTRVYIYTQLFAMAITSTAFIMRAATTTILDLMLISVEHCNTWPLRIATNLFNFAYLIATPKLI